MWVEVVPNGVGEYELVMHDGGEDIALATCHTDEGDATVLAAAFAWCEWPRSTALIQAYWINIS